MASPLRIAIVGYGIAGIAAAIQLRRQGHGIDHFERWTTPVSGGAGLLLHPPVLEMLRGMDLFDAARQRGTPIQRIRGETLHGRSIMELRYADRCPGGSGLGIQRRALVALLHEANSDGGGLRIAHEIVEVDAALGHLRDNHGSDHGPYDLIVAADGVNSRIRKQFPSIVRRDRAYPWAALVCLVDDPHGIGGESVSQHFNGTRHVSFWPAGSESPGAPGLVNISINVPPAQARGEASLGQWKEHIARLCPQLVPILHHARDESVMHPYRFRDVVLRRSSFGRLVLLGDAAHSMSPQLGQGVRMALEDARALAVALARHDTPAEALAAFDTGRRAHVARYQRLSRWLTPAFQSGSNVLAGCRDRLSGPLIRIPAVNRRILASLCDEHA